MSWEIEMYYRLLSEGQLAPGEHGPLPLPADIAHAMERCADGLERHATALADNVMPMAPDELRWLAAEIRDGTPAGRDAFWAALLDLIEIKRGNRPSGGVTRYLPRAVLAPFEEDIEPGVPGKGSGRD